MIMWVNDVRRGQHARRCQRNMGVFSQMYHIEEGFDALRHQCHQTVMRHSEVTGDALAGPKCGDVLAWFRTNSRVFEDVLKSKRTRTFTKRIACCWNARDPPRRTHFINVLNTVVFLSL